MTTLLPNPAQTSGLLASLFPPSVAAYELRAPADPASLLAEEAGTCDGFRPKRLEEFAAGRLCARRALHALDFVGASVPRNADRSPRWPHGAVGSITHTVGFCGAVAAKRGDWAGLGIDAEIVTRVTPELWAHVFTGDESTRSQSLAGPERDRVAAIAFSAKEAFYKAQFALTHAWLDYTDVSVEVAAAASKAGTFELSAATAHARCIMGSLRVRGCYCIEGALVVTGVAIGENELRTFAPALGQNA